MILCRLLAAGAVLVLVGGCSDKQPAEAPSRAATSPAAIEPTPADRSDVPPAGMDWVVSGTGLRFAVPQGSPVIAGDAVDDPGNAARIQQFADTFGGSTLTVKVDLRRSDVLVDGPGSTWVYAVDAGDAEVPDEERLKEKYGGEPGFGKIDTVRTPVGDATIVYLGIMPRRTIYFSAIIWVRLASATAQLTVTTRAFDETTLLVAELIPTLGDLG